MESLYSHPALYASVNDRRSHDLPHYLAMAVAAEGEVLELGAGTGRVTLALARAGCRVVAVERSSDMCALLEERLRHEPWEVSERVTVVVADVTQFELRRKFPLAMCAYSGIAHQTTPETLAAFLERTRAHLADDGVFAFDTRLPNPQILKGGFGYVPWFRHPQYGDACRAVEALRYDPTSQVLEVQMEVTALESEREPERTMLSMRICSQEQWQAELNYSGWEVLAGEVIGEDVYFSCRKSSPSR